MAGHVVKLDQQGRWPARRVGGIDLADRFPDDAA